MNRLLRMYRERLLDDACPPFDTDRRWATLGRGVPELWNHRELPTEFGEGRAP